MSRTVQERVGMLQGIAIMAEGAGKAAGVSSFGMSGVNAHGLFSAAPVLRPTQGFYAPSQLQWQPVRTWFLPPRHNLLLSASGGGGGVIR